MIQQESILQVLGGYKKKHAKLGDMIITSIQELRNKSKITSKVKKGEVYKALIIRTKKTFKKKDGTILFCGKNTKKKNSVILINKKGNLIGTRITEPVPFMLKKKHYTKFTSISPGLI